MSISRSLDITDKGAVCQVCANKCRIPEGGLGICRARTCRDGKVVCDNYGRITSLALDPIEKKPLAMFMPGSMILSVGSYGCNLRCPFCQNAEISMVDSTEVQISAVSPEALVDAAEQLKDRGNIGIAFTYNEPLIGYEFLIDTARQIRDAGMKNVLVSNGSCSREVAMEVIPLMDAMNIDLKAFSAAGYKKLGGDIEQTQAFIELAAKSMSTGGTHLELTTLIVPGFNDSEQDMIEEAKWIASLNDDIVLHVTRFFPRYKMSDGEPTDVRLVYKLADTARKYLHNVFTGNC